MTFRAWLNDLEARAAIAAHERRPVDSRPVEARYALGSDDVNLLRSIDAAFKQERS